MSIHVMSWVFRESESTLGDRLVLLVLADHAKEDGTASWPAVATIASEARLTRRQVQRCLRNLELAGEIEPTGKTKTGTVVYSVTGFIRGRQYVTPGGDISDTGGATNRARGGVVSTPEPSLEQPSELQPSTTAREVLAIWNELAGQKLRSEVWLRKIAACVKLYPELSVDDHRRVIALAFEQPWWDRDPTPAVIYGTTAQFERTINQRLAPSSNGRVVALDKFRRLTKREATT